MGDPLRALLDAIEAKQPTPGGGAVAAWTGAMACALAGMVVAYSLGRRPEHEDALRNARSQFANARSLLMQLGDEDAAAYAELAGVLKMERSDPARAERLGPAVRRAAEVPRIVGATGLNVLRALADLSTICNPFLRSDLAVAAAGIEASIRGAVWMVRANLSLMKDASLRRSLQEETESWLDQAKTLHARIDAACHAPEP